MKTIVFSISFIFISFLITAQVSVDSIPKTPKYKNTLGLNANVFIKQIIDLSSSGGYYYSPYLFTYKRNFKNNAIRFGVNGSINSSKTVHDDTLKPESKRYQYNVGIGFEHTVKLTNRFSLYFGIDFINEYNYNYSLSVWANPNPTTKRIGIDKTTSYGFSPLTGIVFKINDRIQLATETSLDFIYKMSEGHDTNYPQPSIYDSKQTSKSLQTNYHYPANVEFRVRF